MPPAKSLTLAEIQPLANAWAASPKGRTAMTTIEKRASKTLTKIQADARVSPEQLRRPCTI